ncbi:diacylglycerol O-acyltransferase 1 [Rhizoclosmatium sp. JEL0117]|nr:diacylglycerol O-acyltransferase 1 [Rhizoclosmatium sp. JEL0117]
MTYPTESQKGTFFGIFWAIFNLGAVLGNTVGTALVWSSGPDGYAMNDTTYLIFIILMASGSIVALLIQPPGTIIREDKSQVETPPTNALRELIEILKLFTNPAMLTILIPCMSCGWYYTYEFGPFGDLFTGRTAGLKAIFYWLAQAVGSWVLGKMCLDNTKYPRTTRAWTGCLIMAVSTILFFGGGAVFQYVASDDLNFTKIDAEQNFGRFFGPFILYTCYGLHDAFFETYVSYLIGAISNDAETLSRYAGFFKGTQSAAEGISWALNGFAFTREKGNALSSTTQFWIMVIPCIVSLFFMGFYIKLFVKDTSESIQPAKAVLCPESEYLQATSALPSGTPYIFGFHPHGILAISHFMTFGTEALGLSKLYPDLGMVHTTTLASNFSVPIVKDYFMAVGMISVDKEALQYVLRRGESVVIVVGGAREAMDARPGTNVLSLQKRFGFVKIALQTGAPLVPVFAFGENDIWDQVDNGMGTYVRSFQELVKKIFGFSPVLVYGRFGILPYRRDINVVIGKPMIVPKIENPTHEDIQKYHALYLQELQTLYDSRKDEFLPNRKEELIIT